MLSPPIPQFTVNCLRHNNETTPFPLRNLKKALLALAPSGPQGFEGLIGTTLAAIVGIPFRLARSGAQFGVDGKSSDTSISFECKRYCNNVPRESVMAKIGELSLEKHPVDLWILCATSEVGAQLVDAVSQFGTNHITSTMVLDWSHTGIPPLAVLLALAPIGVTAFLESHPLSGQMPLREAISDLSTVSDNPAFHEQATRIREALDNPMLGLEAAKDANKSWLTDTFSSRERAISRLGQPLSPYDEEYGIWHSRHNLTSKIIRFLTGSPSGKALYVIGREGVGKSWAIAESWFSTPIKPLMTFISPGKIGDSVNQSDVREIIVSALIDQTDAGFRPSVQAKWYRILENWRKLGSNQIRCVVVVDGIEQRPRKDWVRILGTLSEVLAVYYCQLIVTARTSYYRRYIAPNLYLPYRKVKVSDWTAAERTAILSRFHIQDAEITEDVAAALCNPRILGIALKLWSRDAISNLNELSISRLLFEHIRTTQQFHGPGLDSLSVVQRIRRHAEDVTSRLLEAKRHDLMVFQADLQTVVEERFFSVLEDDPTCYRINEEGLPLALSFLLLDRIRFASRNGIDVFDELRRILEPISALGMTASVVVAAITVACIDEKQATEEGTAELVRVFADLQNPGDTDLHQLTRLVLDCPGAFAQAARTLCLAGGGQPNSDLVADALVRASFEGDAWSVIYRHIQSWLSAYSLWPPARRLSARNDREARHRTAESKFKINSGEFSDAEKSIMQTLDETSGDVDVLWRLALALLAGRGRRTATRVFVRWAFAATLYPEYPRSSSYFRHLICLNRVDWRETRTVLLKETDILRTDSVSPTGKWALVKILWATGDPHDAHDAQQLTEQLTNDREERPGRWRLVENYCESDPCDPSSGRPSNIGRTSKNYTQIDVGTFQQGVRTQAHLFFDMARPAMARFDVPSAIDKHREYTDSIISKTDFEWRSDLSELRAHNALLSESAIDALRGLVLSVDAENHESDKDHLWLVVQHLMLLSFPFLSGSEQFELLTHCGMEPMLDLVENLQPLEAVTFDQRLETACRSGNEPAQFALLLLACETATPISASSRQLVVNLVNSASDRVRAQALGIIARLRDPTLTADVARTDWCASQNTRYDESCHGARVLAMAAHDRVIPFGTALSRMATRDYGMASRMWIRPSAVREITSRIDSSIRQAAALAADLDPPAVEIRVKHGDRMRPRLAAALDRLFPPDRPYGDAEANNILQENQKNIKSFSTNLEEKGCHAIVDHIDLDEFRNIVKADTGLANDWLKMFVGSSKKKLRVLHNLVLLLGHGLSESNPTQAATLFKLVMNQQPILPVRYGTAGVSLDSLAIWAGPDTEILNDIRHRRLEEAANDDDLSKEALAAHLNRNQHLLRRYIELNINKGEPAAIARALMVAGFSDRSQFNGSVLNKHRGTEGFVGATCEAARYAYDRNLWARHWFGGMCRASDPSEFWRCSVLFLKVVDGRYDFWFQEYGDRNEAMDRFWPNLRGSLDNRVKKWRRNRESKLFGADRPNGVFISTNRQQEGESTRSL